MAKDSIQQFSRTAASNTDIAGINVNVGWSPANVGAAFREMMALLASSLVVLQMDLTGLTSLTLTAAQGAAQVIQFLGVLPGDCTVTIPNTVFVGLAINDTTGGHNVILSAGSASIGVLPQNNVFYFYYCDGVTNVALPNIGQISGTWHNLTSSRVAGTIYTNTTGKTLTASVNLTGNQPSTFVIDGLFVVGTQSGAGDAQNLYADVPPGSVYQVFTANLVVTWLELF